MRKLTATPYWEKTLFNTTWKKPGSSKFVEYDDSDESWLRPLGIGEIKWYFTELKYLIDWENVFG